MKYALYFAAAWLFAWFILPYDSASTHAGAAIGHAFQALGGALVLWAPVAGTIAAVNWTRRKTHP